VNIINIDNIINIIHIADIVNIANSVNIDYIGNRKRYSILSILLILSMPNFDPLGIFNPIPPPQFPIRHRNSTRSLPPPLAARSSSSHILRHL